MKVLRLIRLSVVLEEVKASISNSQVLKTSRYIRGKQQKESLQQFKRPKVIGLMLAGPHGGCGGKVGSGGGVARVCCEILHSIL